jgi:hypothetical protein
VHSFAHTCQEARSSNRRPPLRRGDASFLHSRSCTRSNLCPIYSACPFDVTHNFDSFSDAFRAVFVVTMSKVCLDDGHTAKGLHAGDSAHGTRISTPWAAACSAQRLDAGTGAI